MSTEAERLAAVLYMPSPGYRLLEAELVSLDVSTAYPPPGLIQVTTGLTRVRIRYDSGAEDDARWLGSFALEVVWLGNNPSMSLDGSTRQTGVNSLLEGRRVLVALLDGVPYVLSVVYPLH